MTTDYLDQPQLRARGFEVLVKSLGWVNAVRFVQQYEWSSLNYTAECASILPALDPQQIMDQLEELAPRIPSTRTDDARWFWI